MSTGLYRISFLEKGIKKQSKTVGSLSYIRYLKRIDNRKYYKSIEKREKAEEADRQKDPHYGLSSGRKTAKEKDAIKNKRRWINSKIRRQGADFNPDIHYS